MPVLVVCFIVTGLLIWEGILSSGQGEAVAIPHSPTESRVGRWRVMNRPRDSEFKRAPNSAVSFESVQRDQSTDSIQTDVSVKTTSATPFRGDSGRTPERRSQGPTAADVTFPEIVEDEIGASAIHSLTEPALAEKGKNRPRPWSSGDVVVDNGDRDPEPIVPRIVIDGVVDVRMSARRCDSRSREPINQRINDFGPEIQRGVIRGV